MLLLRSSEHKAFGGTWSAPGGKLEPNETPLEAAIRETLEETGMELAPHAVHFFQTFYVRYPSLDFLYHAFYTAIQEMPEELKLQPREHNAYLWASPKELASLPLMPGAYECLLQLYGDPLQF
jgi:8-oxo-dGTP diphosphatase